VGEVVVVVVAAALEITTTTMEAALKAYCSNVHWCVS
jgi:hypothetical protein